MGLRFLLVFGGLLVVFLSLLLMFLIGSFSYRGFCFWDSLPWKWVFSFFWCLAVFWLFFLVFCLCFCLGPALLEGFVFEGPCHENGSSLSSGCLLVVFLSLFLMFLFGPCSFRGFCFWDSLPWKWVFSFFWCLAVLWLFLLVFCLCFCLGPALLEGFAFETLCHENGSSLSSGVWLSFGCFS